MSFQSIKLYLGLVFILTGMDPCLSTKIILNCMKQKISRVIYKIDEIQIYAHIYKLHEGLF